jgi:hypothetical protein
MYIVVCFLYKTMIYQTCLIWLNFIFSYLIFSVMCNDLLTNYKYYIIRIRQHRAVSSNTSTHFQNVVSLSILSLNSNSLSLNFIVKCETERWKNMKYEPVVFNETFWYNFKKECQFYTRKDNVLRINTTPTRKLNSRPLNSLLKIKPFICYRDTDHILKMCRSVWRNGSMLSDSNYIIFVIS